ncbi:MAG: DUF2577 domain-containing protein [Firmicutes bacterium]|nr:DUF2577 domain-containing protein [Bacillota bacterium]
MSGSKLIELMRQQAAGLVPRGIELATVVTPPPDLRIRIDNMNLNLEGDDLIVCEHLLDHERRYSTVPAISDSIETPAGLGPHVHQIQSLTINDQIVTIKTKLQAGDRVAVMALPGEQQYLVIDKVVIMGG